MNSKKVLILDESKISKERLVLLATSITNFEIDTPVDVKSAKELFDNHTYAFIILEHNCKISDEFMTYVLSLNPKQKMILLSDSINCPVDCDTCVDTFKFIRLLKPISIDNIVKYLLNGDNENFICPNKYRFDNIDSLEKLYDFVYLDENFYFTQKELKDDTLYIRTKLSGTLRFEELAKIEDNVNKKYFNLTFTEDNDIAITQN
ncbi:MAG: hypothetical protein ACNI28_06890 [Arcobacter sp.]|uniref:hypothetical protein n=1 Tax=Arcobacter sp. TaxID=1872629 RepID=UPI003B00D0B8